MPSGKDSVRLSPRVHEDTCANTTKHVLFFAALLLLSAALGTLFRPVYWELYATFNPMRSTPRMGAAIPEHEGDIPSTEESLADVPEVAEEQPRHRADSSLALSEEMKDIAWAKEKTQVFGTRLQQGVDKGGYRRDGSSRGSGAGKTEGEGPARDATEMGSKDSVGNGSKGRPDRGGEERSFHANPYINNAPAGRPVTLRRMISVHEEIHATTAAAHLQAATVEGKAALDAEVDAASPSCRTRSDCAEGRLCAAGGRCVCPILYSGNANCTAHANIERWCITPVTAMGFAEFAKGRVKTSAVSHISGGKGDINARAHWDSCAIVGSSGLLLRTKHGRAIDNHTAVIRFNDAPTKRKEDFVGSRTTLRIQNRYYCGFTEHPGELCMHYTQDPIHYCPNWRKCKVLSPTVRTLLYIHQYWRVARPPPPRDPGRPNAKLSAGFYGIALAAHVCGSIDLYGFKQADNHYYKKQQKVDPNGKKKQDNCGRWGCGKDKPFRLRHMWSYERRCIDAMRQGKLPNIRVFD